MATQLRIKRGTTDANAPTGLTAGEMAINLVDKKLYVGGTAGTNTIFLDSTAVAVLGTANTFTALNTFSAGISASGATFTGLISGATATFSKDITVNSMTVGLGGSSDTTNVAIGGFALASNTSDSESSGIYNVAIGGFALTTNTTGANNTAIGGGALASNTSGQNNIAIGYGALTSSETASSNIAIGTFALAFGSLGASNIGIGSETLGAAGNTGNSNVAVGYQSLQQNTTGSNNTGVGSSALSQLTTASQMTALGNNAGRFRGTGTDTNTTGSGGIYIGYQARGSTLAQTNEIVIGVNALGLGSHTAVIGATLQSAATIYGVLNLPSGLSASGATFSATTASTSSATGALIVAGGVGIAKDSYINTVRVGLGAAGSNNTTLGAGTGTQLTAGSAACTMVGFQAGFWNTSGNGNTSVGQNCLLNTRTGSWNTGLGINAIYTNQSGSHNVSVGLEGLYNVTSDSNTGIGSNSGYHLTGASTNNICIGYIAGKFQADGSTALTTSSNSCYIGTGTRGLNNSDSNSVVIGANAIGLGANTTVIGVAATTAATIYGVLNLPSGLSASGATFTGNISAPNIVSSFNGATGTVTGASLGANTFTALNTFSAGISASGATFSAPISSTRMARHTSAAISAEKTADFSPTAAEDGTVFFINYSGKGLEITLDALPIGWRAKFLNVGNGTVSFVTNTGDIYGEGYISGLGNWLMEAICIDTNTYFVG